MKIFKNRNQAIYLPILFAAVMIAGIFMGNLFSSLRVKSIVNNELQRHSINNRGLFGAASGFSITPKNNKINSALYYILNDYVDTVSSERISESAIPAMLENLDPHSVYIPAQDFQKYNEPLTGNFSGIGVQFSMNEDTVAIISTIPNGPSERVGILAGDRIIKVDGEVVAGVKMPSDDIVSKLKGEKGTSVRVTIVRRGAEDPLEFDIIRDDIPLYSVDVHYMIDDKIGYIKISQFAQTTYREFLSAANDLKSQGMEKIIIDLRNNGGGIMEAATALADLFLQEGKLIVYTEGRARPRKNEYATSRELLLDEEVVILIDEASASASEILAGAIQDNDRGLIIGRRSFGKGLVQEQLKFFDGSAIRLTVAKYYTPTGRSIQKPYTNGRDEYYNDLHNRFIQGEFEYEDSIKFSDSLKYVTPGGKIVYGGGGIMPDIFVAASTEGVTDYYNSVLNLGLIYRFAFHYTDLHRSEMINMKTADEIADYLDTHDFSNEFIRYAKEKGVDPNYEQFRESKDIITTQIKAYVARNMIDNVGFYPIIRSIDDALNVAIDTLSAM
jgi:carboxyl-terminal processing protease